MTRIEFVVNVTRLRAYAGTTIYVVMQLNESYQSISENQYSHQCTLSKKGYNYIKTVTKGQQGQVVQIARLLEPCFGARPSEDLEMWPFSDEATSWQNKLAKLFCAWIANNPAALSR